MSSIDSDTICAIATPSGRGGIGIVRISGPACLSIARAVIGFAPTPRYAHYCDFLNSDGMPIEKGIALYFSAPNSFTGEDIFEFQGHGGSQIVQTILKEVIKKGARLARPGEFSERSFLNGKIDLLQAEAIADLIEASSEQAAKSAVQTLQGVFSARIHDLVSQLISLRVQAEAHIDFSDEELDLDSSKKIQTGLKSAQQDLKTIITKAQQGVLLKNGLTVAIAGKPNAGKSSLLNALAEVERAIVTDIPGTTRDILQEQISIDGLPLNIVDTAGLRDSDDIVEQEGIRRANIAIGNADRLLIVVDASDVKSDVKSSLLDVLKMLNIKPNEDRRLKHISVVLNKTDLVKEPESISRSIEIEEQTLPLIPISAKSHQGLESLRQHLTKIANYSAAGEGSFIARERHLISLRKALEHIAVASEKMNDFSQWDLLAEELRISQQELNKITGDFSSDDLLGEIFSNFCVGK